MEDMLIQSANMEIALWQNFGTGRTANATALLAIVVAVWVAARFSSVSLERTFTSWARFLLLLLQ